MSKKSKTTYGGGWTLQKNNFVFFLLEFMNRFDIVKHSSYASDALYNVLSRRKSIIRKIPFASKLTHSISPTIRKYARLTIITKQ